MSQAELFLCPGNKEPTQTENTQNLFVVCVKLEFFDADLLHDFRSARNLLPLCWFSVSMGARTEFVLFFLIFFLCRKQALRI